MDGDRSPSGGEPPSGSAAAAGGDRALTVTVPEPCPNCPSARPEPLATMTPGASADRPVLANGSTKVSTVEGGPMARALCLPVMYSTVPAEKSVALSRPATSRAR